MRISDLKARRQPFDPSTGTEQVGSGPGGSEERGWNDGMVAAGCGPVLKDLVLIGLLKLFEELGGRDDL
jgi:hypothetical protein